MGLNLVSSYGTLHAVEFYCNESKHWYRVAGSRSTYGGTNPFKDSAWLAMDRIKRDDGKVREFTRREMAQRFQDVELGPKEEPKEQIDEIKILYDKYNLKKYNKK